jgi:lactoylglutathione lyase
MDLISTFLWVDDVPAAAAFYQEAFGLVPTVLEENPGRGWRAEFSTGVGGLSIADTVELTAALGIADHVGLDGSAPAAVQLTFGTEDVEAAHAAALAHGATSLAPPTAMPWGQTIARVRAPHGVLISVVGPTGGTR